MVNLSKFPSGRHTLTAMMIDINAFYYAHCATTNCIGLDWIGSFSLLSSTSDKD